MSFCFFASDYRALKCSSSLGTGPETHLDAVGTIIADRPPHTTVRARLRIRLPPWMSGGEA
jgi:hypothetical protein